jgi:hypothetical protein
LSNFENLIEDFNHITLEQVMAFASWFMGDYGQLLVVGPLTDMKMKYIDVNAPGNPGLVACFKQECCTASCLVWLTIKNHLTTTSYKALLVHKKEFAFECKEKGDITYEGFTLLRMIYIIVKPNVVVDVKDLQNMMEKMMSYAPRCQRTACGQLQLSVSESPPLFAPLRDPFPSSTSLYLSSSSYLSSSRSSLNRHSPFHVVFPTTPPFPSRPLIVHNQTPVQIPVEALTCTTPGPHAGC